MWVYTSLPRLKSEFYVLSVPGNTDFFIDYMLRLPIKAEKCHCHLSCKSLSPGYAMTEMPFIFTTPLTTPEFTTKSSSRVLK